MNSNAINSILNDIECLSEDDKDYLREIIYKQLVEYKRESILHRAKESETNYNAGSIKKGSTDDLFEDLKNDWIDLGSKV